MIDRIFSGILLPLIFLGLTFGGAGLNLYLTAGQAWETSGAREQEPVKLRTVTHRIQTAAEARVAHRQAIIDFYYRLQLLMGKRAFNDFTLLKALDGGLNSGSFVPPDPPGLRETAKHYQVLKDSAVAVGGQLVFFSPPVRPVRGAAVYEPGMPWLDVNPRVDKFLNYLREYDVDFIDARFHFTDVGTLTPDQVMYKTDVFWTSRAAFEGFRQLVTGLEDLFDLRLDPDGYYRDRNNYDQVTYSQLFLGGLGRRSSFLVAGLDDFTAIKPKFDSNYAVEIFDQSLGLMKQQGHANQTLFFDSQMRPPAATGAAAGGAKLFLPYNYYLLGLHSMVTVKNLDRPDGPRILLIQDSFGVPVGCFLAPLAGELVMVDPLATDYVPELDRFIGEKKFDLVIILFSINNI